MNIKKQPLLTKEFIDTETNILKDLVQVYVQSRGKEDVWQRLILKKILLLSERHQTVSIKDVFFLFFQIMKLFASEDYHRLELRTKNEALFFCLDQWKVEASQSLSLSEKQTTKNFTLDCSSTSMSDSLLNGTRAIRKNEDNNKIDINSESSSSDGSNILNQNNSSGLIIEKNSKIVVEKASENGNNNNNNNIQNSGSVSSSSTLSSNSTIKTGNKDLDEIAFFLKQDGFSPTSIEEMLKEFKDEKLKVEETKKKMEDNKIRLKERMVQYKFKEKSVIPEDGNCQFSSVSDQIFGDIDSHGYFRDIAVNWIVKNQDCVLPNGSCLKNYIYDFESVEKFCEDMARPGIWGNHLTLVALAEITERKIVILSSVASSAHCLMEIVPKVIAHEEPILLSHFAEYHYGSLCKDEDTS